LYTLQSSNIVVDSREKSTLKNSNIRDKNHVKYQTFKTKRQKVTEIIRLIFISKSVELSTTS
jgi:hypothetical protein